MVEKSAGWHVMTDALEYHDAGHWLAAGQSEPPNRCDRCGCDCPPCMCEGRELLQVATVFPEQVLVCRYSDGTVEFHMRDERIVLACVEFDGKWTILRDDVDIAGRKLPRWIDEPFMTDVEKALAQ